MANNRVNCPHCGNVVTEYTAYFIHTTGKLFRSNNVDNNPSGDEWKEISEDTFNLCVNVANYAFHGWYNIFPE